ncbi:hemolysin secretion protein D [Noviherbaspirillum aridicola]|uniref:Hemolysin secretion protein D n=1 Tax=Noviherbaspirillum aridicola TaxID=2849687 RepID=A0ABQ4Q430_9BURK|nr:efflux RND transporter periplasmic adaptor subunit [Noviherbaspirillum aridicola]GIZ51514.1 hemolysin secretion protein D [Noviherbaspirillum aridicola]
MASPNPRNSSRSPRARLSLIVLAGALALSACSKQVEKAEDIRPVRVVRVATGSVAGGSEFSGEVRARVESRLGFRVGGKITERKVDVGASVRRGQVLMQLDPRDLQLAQAQANAGLKAAESNRDLARAELKRYQELREKNFVSQAVLDSKETAFRSAQASYDQALAAFRNQSNQAGYAVLVADADGVVTGVDAEVGQVVAAGTPVVRVAQLGEKEVVIGIPEDQVDALRKATNISIRTWAQPDRSFDGKLRELSPVADPATRTYAARIAIPGATDDIRLGMTAYVSFQSASADNAIRLPLTALHQDKSGTSVWVVENGTVRQVPVQVSGTAGNEVLVSGGLSAGQTVVTAGVNQLRPGQKVKLLGEESVAANGAAK